MSGGSQYDIAIIRTDGTGYRKLTDDPASDRHPRWSPDGKRIAFSSRRSADRFNIWAIRFDGSGLEQLDESGGTFAVWSPDGSFLAYRPGYGAKIISVDEAERQPPQIPAFVEEGVEFIASSWSPNGRRLAGYRRFQDARNAGVVVYSFGSQEFELLTESGRNPVWLNDNRRLVYFDPDDDGLFLVSSDTKQRKPLGRCGLFPALSPDNQFIYASIADDEADIWLLTLESRPKQ
jgi:TolB protein